MMWTNSADRYGAIAQALHWVIAFCVVAMLCVGLSMGGIEDRALRFQVYSFHKALGITILALIAVRLTWKLFNWNLPRPNPDHPRWEHALAAAVHWGFYALLIAMPLSGWIMTSAANSTINWFGYFAVPAITEPDQALRETMASVHQILAWTILVFIGLHVAGVLKHLVIDRDGTLRRMLPFGAFVLMMLGALPAQAMDWTIDREQSLLGFQATQEGAPFKGQFKAFDGTISFDPDKPEAGKALITIDLGSIDSQNPERDQTVKDKDWFDTATNPTATYAIDRFEKGSAPGQYVAKGRLMLRGLERPLDLPFTLKTVPSGDTLTAIADGETSLKRLDFGVGDGEWESDSMVGHEVRIAIHLVASAKAP